MTSHGPYFWSLLLLFFQNKSFRKNYIGIWPLILKSWDRMGRSFYLTYEFSIWVQVVITNVNSAKLLAVIPQNMIIRYYIAILLFNMALHLCSNWIQSFIHLFLDLVTTNLHSIYVHAAYEKLKSGSCHLKLNDCIYALCLILQLLTKSLLV